MRSIYVNRIESLGRSLREGASPGDDHDPRDQSPSIGMVRGCLTSDVVSCQNVEYLSFFIRNVGDDGPSSSPRGFSLSLSQTPLRSHVPLSLDVPVSQRPVIKNTLDLQYFDK